MLQAIPWQTFIAVSVSLIICYYLIVGLLYFRKEMAGAIKGKTGKAGPSVPEDADTTSHDPFTASREAVQKIKAVISTAVEKNYPAGELLFAFQMLLRQYPSLKEPAFQKAINNSIQAECLAGNLPVFNEDELSSIWNG